MREKTFLPVFSRSSRINSVNSILYGSLLQHNYFFNSILFLLAAVAMWPWERHSLFFIFQSLTVQYFDDYHSPVRDRTLPRTSISVSNPPAPPSKLRLIIWNVQTPTQKWGLSTSRSFLRQHPKLRGETPHPWLQSCCSMVEQLPAYPPGRSPFILLVELELWLYMVILAPIACRPVFEACTCACKGNEAMAKLSVLLPRNNWLKTSKSSRPK